MSIGNADKLQVKFGKNVKKYRLAQDMTQHDLADILEIAEQTVSKIERGVFAPSAETIIQVCDALKVTPNDLMLNKPDLRKRQASKLAQPDHSAQGITDHINMVQELWAQADAAKVANDTKLESAYIDQIIQMYAWRPDQLREVAQWLDRRYLNDYLDKMEKEVRTAKLANLKVKGH